MSEAKYKLKTDLRFVAEWCCRNSLLINPEKTKFMLVGSRQLLKSIPENMSLKFLNKTIVPTTFIKDLGITIDHNLTYSKHISQLTSECMAKLCQMNRVKHCFDLNTLTYIICTGSTVCSNTSAANIRKLQIVQIFACRIIREKI